MSNFQDVLDDIALLIGGTKQIEPPPGFYSGARNGDATGVTGLNGCFSRPPRTISEPPVGIVLPRSFRATLNAQGWEDQEDIVRLIILVKPVDLATDMAILEPFRDSIPAAFRTHFQLNSTTGAVALSPQPLYAFVQSGKLGATNWQGDDFHSWEFEIRILRNLQTTYTS